MMTIDVHIDYAADDSCQILLWARGHHDRADFLKACEIQLIEWDGRSLSLAGKPIKHVHYRTVKADAETKSRGVCDTIRIESKAGKGAYQVTVLDEWLPLFAHEV